MSTEHYLSLLSSPRIEPWVLSKLRSEASSIEQVESSWTGERRSPAPGENMAAPLPTGERGLQALQSGSGLSYN